MRLYRATRPDGSPFEPFVEPPRRSGAHVSVPAPSEGAFLGWRQGRPPEFMHAATTPEECLWVRRDDGPYVVHEIEGVPVRTFFGTQIVGLLAYHQYQEVERGCNELGAC